MPHWEHPAGLFLALAALPIIALYLLRHRRPPKKLPSLFLFAQVQRDQKAASTWRRLTPELSLFLQLLLVGLAALTAASPTWGATSAQTTLAVVLDVSASMATHEGDADTRLDLARAEARALLKEHAGSRILLVLAGAEPRLAAGQDAASLESELEAQVAEDVEADLEGAVALAEEKLRGEAGARFVVLTDPGSSYETSKPNVRVQRFGTAHDNVGVFTARASLAGAAKGPAALELSAVVLSFADTERDARVQLLQLATPNGERTSEAPLQQKSVHLLPRARTPVRFEVPGAEGAYAIALADADALDRDDRAVAVAPVSSKLPVVVVSAAGAESALGRALLANEHLALQFVTAEEHARIDVAPDALEIFVDACPTLRRGRDALVFGPPPGRCLDVDVAEPSAEVRTLDGFRGTDPRVRFLTLDDVHAEHATTLRPRGGEGVLAEDRRGPLVVDASTPARLITLVGFSPSATDFTRQRSFVIFLRNLTELAERHRTRASRSALRAGEATSLAVPEDVTALTLDGQPLVAHAGDVVVPARPRAGLAILRWSEPRPAALLVPVELGTTTESELRQGRTETASAQSPTVTQSTRWAQTHLRLLLAVCIALLLAFETVVFGRRPAWMLPR